MRVGCALQPLQSSAAPRVNHWRAGAAAPCSAAPPPRLFTTQPARMPSTRGAHARASRAAAAPAGSPSLPVAAVRPARTALVLLNEGTKFVVSATALATLLHYRSAGVAWALFGSILTSIAGKLLKRLLAHARPAGARKADPGMPSSHAVSLSYLSTYASVSLLAGAPGQELAACALQALGVSLTALRVVLHYHTVPQVVVGYGFGAGAALMLHRLSLALLPTLQAAPNTLSALYAATGLAVALFAAAGARSWAQDAAYMLRLTGARKS